MGRDWVSQHASGVLVWFLSCVAARSSLRCICVSPDLCKVVNYLLILFIIYCCFTILYITTFFIQGIDLFMYLSTHQSIYHTMYPCKYLSKHRPVCPSSYLSFLSSVTCQSASLKQGLWVKQMTPTTALFPMYFCSSPQREHLASMANV